ncbi:hypothetical protein [Chelativorans composti]|uniref:Uncharacterized protein n=1 Tax=Chelativorans composti TaxID=768533 RepID=A0ABW5DEP6_9HYPH
MTDTLTLTDHDAIRDWAAARAGQPAMSDAAPALQDAQTVLRIVFGQHAYQDTDTGPDRPDGVTIIEWDDWFRIFDERGLALVVADEPPGSRSEWHELVRRG